MTGRAAGQRSTRRPAAVATSLERDVEHGLVRHLGQAFEYEIVRSTRRYRTIELSMDYRGLRVAAPMRTSRREIDQFVRTRIPWILKQQRARATRREPLQFVDGELLPIEGRMMPLLVTVQRQRRVAVDLDLFNIHITVPTRLEDPQRGEARHDAIVDAMIAWYFDRAQDALEASVTRWAPIVGRAPRRILVRNQRRRWGSCGPDGTLRFNWRLVMLQPPLLDYVVAHELTHLEVLHHGPAFWAALQRIMPDHVARQERMKRVAGIFPVW